MQSEYKFGRCSSCDKESCLKNGRCSQCNNQNMFGEFPECFNEIFGGFNEKNDKKRS